MGPGVGEKRLSIVAKTLQQSILDWMLDARSDLYFF